jgi:hypothetical protein
VTEIYISISLQATDLDEIIKAHAIYIERVLERCLMTSKVKESTFRTSYIHGGMSFVYLFLVFLMCSQGGSDESWDI